MNRMTEEEMVGILYPRRFLSKQDLDFYLDGDLITCLICNKSFERLSKHITSGHGCSTRLYKDTLNIPRTSPLTVKRILARTSVIAKKIFENASEEKKKVLTDGGYNKSGYRGSVVSTIAKENRLLPLKAAGMANKGRKHGKEMGFCSSCGKEMVISSIRVNRVNKCVDCGGRVRT